MFSIIYKVEKTIKECARFSLPPQKALVCFIKQRKGDFETWKYPNILDGMWESTISRNHWYFDDGQTVWASYPAKVEDRGKI